MSFQRYFWIHWFKQLNNHIRQSMLRYFVDVLILEIYWRFRRWKSYENRLEIGEVTDKSLGTRFWTTLCIVFIHLQSELSVMYTF